MIHAILLVNALALIPLTANFCYSKNFLKELIVFPLFVVSFTLRFAANNFLQYISAKNAVLKVAQVHWLNLLVFESS
jgi:hypothetical protein